MTLEELLEKYKRKYPGVPYEILSPYNAIISDKNGKLHSYIDAPAAVFLHERTKTKKEEWHYEGRLHRENDKPAVIWDNGTKYWFYNGRLHRENDKPAVITSKGKKEYWFHGKQYDPTDTPKQNKNRIDKLTAGKSSKQKQREDLLKEFVVEMLGM